MIKNRVIQVELPFVHILLEELIKKKYYFVELFGKEVVTKNRCIEVIAEKFQLPSSDPDNLDAFLDWMRDLSWLEADGYALIIYDYNSFLEKNIKFKEDILELFDDVILPFWENEVEQVVVEGRKKSFNLYLVSGS